MVDKKFGPRDGVKKDDEKAYYHSSNARHFSQLKAKLHNNFLG